MTEPYDPSQDEELELQGYGWQSGLAFVGVLLVLSLAFVGGFAVGGADVTLALCIKTVEVVGILGIAYRLTLLYNG